MKKRSCLIVVLLASLWTVGHAYAVQKSSRFVLIVGNNHSHRSDLARLHFADDDAIKYARLFGAFSERVVVLSRLDDTTQHRYPGWAGRVLPASKGQLFVSLNQLYRQIEEQKIAGVDTELFVVFVGHGGVDKKGRGFLHLEDARLLRHELFQKILARSPASTTHLVVDSCHAYAFVAGRGENSLKVSPDELRFFQEFLKGSDLEQLPDVGVLLASNSKRETHEWSKIESGVFSHLVRSALSGAADINGDGLVEYSEIAAFVDSATATLQGPSHEMFTFAWAPMRNRSTPLVDLSQADAPLLLLGDQLSGHYYIETERGEFWSEFHKTQGQRLAIVLLPDKVSFLRDAQHELQLQPQRGIVVVDSPPGEMISSSKRSASALEYERSLFRQPYSADFYLGFLRGHKHLMPVSQNAQPFVPQQQVQQVEKQAPPAESTAQLTLGAAYVLSNSPLQGEQLENGLRLKMDYALWRGLKATLQAGAAVSLLNGAKAPGLVRTSLLPGLAYHFVVMQQLHLAVGAELGYNGFVFAALPMQGDLLGAMGRTYAELRWIFHPQLCFCFTVGGSALTLTIDRREQIFVRPEMSAGLSWVF